MGYFPNGTSAIDYEARYCSRCAHEDGETGCPVMMLHILHGYDEANNDASFLHTLIPFNDDGLGNARCAMFVDRERLLSPRALAKIHGELQAETPPLLRLAGET